jgi:hypothetical protein
MNRPRAALGAWLQRLLTPCILLILLAQNASADLLLEEGFNYPAGSALASNVPWSGTVSTQLLVVPGNLSLTNFRATLPAGNMLQITNGSGRTAYRTFTTNAVTGGAVYCSMLFSCQTLPSTSKLILALMQSGNTSPNQPDDPLDFYLVNETNSCTFRIGHTGNDPVTVRGTFATNVIHLIVLKYTFGSGGVVSIYVDPVPGAPEPSFPNAQTESDEGNDAANLQTILLEASSGSGVELIDTLRVATDWSSVDPAPVPLTLVGPSDQAVCYGDSVTFSVAATGTPPFSYLWQTNGIAVKGATNASLTLTNPTVYQEQLKYDVVVQDAYGAVTSRLAGLVFSTNAPFIITEPTSPLVLPGVTNALFQVAVGGDAPLSYQWLSNGTNIPGATNTQWLLNNPGAADATNGIAVVISNPCGSVTSAPPVSVLYPTIFNAVCDAGPGFFGGENIIFTNLSGLAFCAWSSPDLSVPVTQWNFEGPFSEMPLGATGYSRYGLNLNPVTSPVYYIVAPTNTGPYTPIEVVVEVSTPDFSTFTIINTNLTITTNGYLDQNIFQSVSDAGPGFFSGENLILTNVSGLLIYGWSSADLSVPVTNWNSEGAMSEIPLGTSGYSRYGINVNPGAPTNYYIFSSVNTGPYAPVEALTWLTTPDFVSFSVAGTSLPIGQDGVFLSGSSDGLNTFFSGTDGGAGIGGGEKVVLNAPSGLLIQAWSASDPSIPVPNWNSLGTMIELPQGNSGQSLYGITATPSTSPQYYIFATNNAGPYPATEPVAWLSSSNFSSFTFAGTNAGISGSGVFDLPALPEITQFPAGKTVIAGQPVSLAVAASGLNLGYQWSFNSSLLPGAVTPVLMLSNVAAPQGGFYLVTITNSSGAAVSAGAQLSVLPRPAMSLQTQPGGGFQVSGLSATGLTYVLEMATNIARPVWQMVGTNNTGTNGIISFQPTHATGAPQFFRLLFP